MQKMLKFNLFCGILLMKLNLLLESYGVVVALHSI